MGHKLVFNGIDSSDYGIIISGAGTYATPERDITSLSVPGRNGDIHFDNGRYNNIQVTYECGISKGFESKYLPFMRQMLSAPVYSRLEDDYHLDEFRLGTFRAEMVPDVGTIMRSGKFELVFDCKPQRYLKAGERPLPQISSASAPGITEIESGYWSQVFSSDFITTSGIGAYPDRIITVIDTSSFAGTGKFLILHYSDERAEESLVDYDTGVLVGRSNIDPTQAGIPSSYDYLHYDLYNNDLKIGLTSDWSYTFFETPAYYDIVDSNDDVVASVFPTKVTIYNPTGFAAKPLIRFHYTTQASLWRQQVCIINGSLITLTLSNVQSVSGHLVYVTDYYLDCETSDAYVDLPGYMRPMNVNKDLYLPQEVTLQPGENTIMLNNSVDYIEITPRWWRL